MIVSVNRLIGSLVDRTCLALNGNAGFKESLKGYAYSEDCFLDGNFLLHYYPGTNTELSNLFLLMGKGGGVKFPGVLNFQSVRQERTGSDVTLYYNLAFVGSVLSEWTTEERESEVFDLLLRPVYEEFMKQLESCEYFDQGYGGMCYDYYEVFSTGGSSSRLKNRYGSSVRVGELHDFYGDYVDAIELHDLKVRVRKDFRNYDL